MSWPGVFERSAEREQLRRRVLAFAGIWFLLAGILAAVGLGLVLLASLVLVLVACLVVGGLRLLRSDRTGRAVGGARRSVARASRSGKARVSDYHLGERVRSRANVVSNVVSQQAKDLLESHQRRPAEPDRRRQALQLNTAGAHLRREGKYEQAADQHRAALALAREVGDSRAEALTLNNLALALVHTGNVAVAVEHFEQALVLFRNLGDQEHEGQVIANLGIVRRRQGRDEDAEFLFSAALDKLPPESSAYRQVEEQLRRAS